MLKQWSTIIDCDLDFGDFVKSTMSFRSLHLSSCSIVLWMICHKWISIISCTLEESKHLFTLNLGVLWVATLNGFITLECILLHFMYVATSFLRFKESFLCFFTVGAGFVHWNGKECLSIQCATWHSAWYTTADGSTTGVHCKPLQEWYETHTKQVYFNVVFFIFMLSPSAFQRQDRVRELHHLLETGGITRFVCLC